VDTAALSAYIPHSAFSDPGAQAEWLHGLPADIATLREAVSSLVFHYMGGGDWEENGIAPERRPEVDLRYADAMFGRLRELTRKPLGEHRLPHERIIGCCRDFTLLYVSLLRHHGIPARSRVGFATYLNGGWATDHVVAEVWDSREERWRLIDAEFGAVYTDPTDGVELDMLDLPRDRFIVAPDAWLRCREGGEDPDRYLVSPFLDTPGLRGWPYILHDLVLDLAALNKQELILWDDWGIGAEWDRLTEDQLTMLDETARTMISPDVTLEELRRLYDQDAFRVPDVVTSWSSAAKNPPLQVALRGG
jgi:hypothetical protein